MVHVGPQARGCTSRSRRDALAELGFAVRPLDVVCFPHYVELRNEKTLGLTARRFGVVVSKLVNRMMRIS